MRSPLSIFKPSGMPCFPFHEDPSADCLLARLLEHHPEQAQMDWPEGFPGGIAHRLDIPTSGQILVARDLEHLVQIRRLFSEKQLRKTYYFLSRKRPTWRENTVSVSIAHDRKRKKKMVVQRGRNTPKRGRWLDAETHFQHIISRGDIHLWRAIMRTGVMHQIRIHAAFCGIALLGDRLYGGGESPDDFPSLFALHHRGIETTAFTVRPASFPEWWPEWTKGLDLD